MTIGKQIFYHYLRLGRKEEVESYEKYFKKYDDERQERLRQQKLINPHRKFPICAENKRWQWRASHPNEYEWLLNYYGKNKFATKTYDYLVAYGSIPDEIIALIRDKIQD
jgi:hypothetical protein